MNIKKSLLALLSLIVIVTSITSCKIESTNPAVEVDFQDGYLNLRLRTNLDYTNDTNDMGYYMVTYEGIEDVLVSASINRQYYYSNPNYAHNFSDEVITGRTDDMGDLVLALPVGERTNIPYNVSIGEKRVEQITWNGNEKRITERIAWWPSSFTSYMFKGKEDYQIITMYLQ